MTEQPKTYPHIVGQPRRVMLTADVKHMQALLPKHRRLRSAFIKQLDPKGVHIVEAQLYHPDDNGINTRCLCFFKLRDTMEAELVQFDLPDDTFFRLPSVDDFAKSHGIDRD